VPLFESECAKCGSFEWYSPRPISDDKPCPKCGGVTERLFSLSHPQIFKPFWTSHIDADGKPLHITSQQQLSRECRKNGVIPVEMDHSNDA
jgi:hypothetical protein